VLATVLTITEAAGMGLGRWWSALVQAHGHIQLYGWAGLFVVGVALHFLPRLRGVPLAAPWLVNPMIGTLVTSLILRVLAQPLAVASGAGLWRSMLAASGTLECVGIGVLLAMLALTARRCGDLSSPLSELTIAPWVISAFVSLGVAAAVNAFNVVQAARMPLGIVPSGGDSLNVTFGLFGFLVPMTLAMSAQTLPMYAGIAIFPKMLLLPAALTYEVGLMLLALGTAAGSQAGAWAGIAEGLGTFTMGAILVTYVAVFVALMRGRGRLSRAMPPPARTSVRGAAHRHGSAVRLAYRPFVLLVASAYLWALVGGALMMVNGWARLTGGVTPVNPDAVRHSLTIGYVALLICGVASRMVPGFSRGTIASPWLVRVTLWLGNGAALLRVGPLLLAPWLVAVGGDLAAGLSRIAFALSGPLGLALAICLAINLWPALWPPCPSGQHCVRAGDWC
jgi:uncharacterized protein involved in response to NO